MKTKTSRKDFKKATADNSAAVAKASKSSKGNRKWETVENEFLPSFKAADLAGTTVEGKIVAFEDWKKGRMAGTSITLDNSGFLFRIPAYGSIVYRLAKSQGNKELDRKKIVGKRIRLTHVGTKPSKSGQDMQLFDVAVAK